MKATTRILAKIAIATLFGAPLVPANATVVDFFNGTNLYAQMTTSGGTSFNLSFVGTGVSSAGFINELFMDGPSGTFTNTTSAAVTTVSGTYILNGFNGGGGLGSIYDWRIDFPQSGSGSSRFTVGEVATWDIVITNPSQFSFNKLHINAFDGQNSIKLDGCISGTTGCGGGDGGGGGGGGGNAPEPGTLALVGLGLLVAVKARKRQLS